MDEVAVETAVTVFERMDIRPVEANGPDIVSNGLALSGTAHWMFDRGLISLSDDLGILISRHVNDPDGVRALKMGACDGFQVSSSRTSDNVMSGLGCQREALSERLRSGFSKESRSPVWEVLKRSEHF